MKWTKASFSSAIFERESNVYSHTLQGVRPYWNVAGKVALVKLKLGAQRLWQESVRSPGSQSPICTPQNGIETVLSTQKVKPCSCHIILAYERH
jgi:hypothetical protein